MGVGVVGWGGVKSRNYSLELCYIHWLWIWITGMLEEGEMLVLGGSWLYYNNIDFLDADAKNPIKPSIGKGRLCLTNQRLLILSAENVLGIPC